jgi:hypothetical protein
VNSRLDQVPVVAELAGALGDAVQGLYLGGSVASGDYRPGVSDIDAVALVDRPPGPAARRHLTDTHQRLGREVAGAADLHCAYVSRRHVGDGAYRHWTWAFDELFRRPFSGIARAELLADPVVVHGPAPSRWLPAMSVEDVRDAARAELSGYWTGALRRRAIWQQDVYVDHGVTTVARADLTIRDGRLVTKTEAITHLAHLGLPAEILDGVTRRREGDEVPISAAERDQRAETVRAFVRTQIARLLT